MRNATKTILAIAAVAVLAAACNPPDFATPNEIEDLRILAVRPDPIEARPGDEVTITGLGVNADGTLYEGVWVWLLLSGLEFGAETTDPESLDLGAISPEQIGWQEPGGDPFVWTVPDADGLRDLFGAYDDRGTIVTVAAVIVGGSETIDDVLDGGEQRFALKTFLLSDRPDDERNVNPVFDTIDAVYPFGGAPENDDGVWVIPKGGGVDLVAKFDDLVGEYITYSWFSLPDTLTEFSTDKVQTWEMPDVSPAYVFVVCRNNYDFDSPEGFRTRSTGIAFGTAAFRWQ